ncbi:unnamed protein product [Adineta steineri]|uniref:F-box domain-containing protein n=1 Tax=Adineta steineri TaxID=433720 RepID=A0A815BU01_9BILA|nr:unnamed protein product [Adineta steineri]
MPNKAPPSLHTLPIEIIYCILDNLDRLEILLSFRDVCTRLNAITNTYPRYQTLTTLDLADNGISVKGGQSLANALQNNTTLTTLDLGSNWIGTEGAQHVANALQNNKTLTILDLGDNKMGDEGARFLAYALQNNKVSHTFE